MCFCGREKEFELCCQKVHQNHNSASTAEDLMRSRYSAFATGNGEYLMDSHLEEYRPVKEKKSIVKWAKSVEWLKLEVINTEKGLAQDNDGIVEFNAFFMENGTIQCLHEVSTFKKVGGLWFYEKALL